MLITQADWARRHGFSRQYVTQLVRKGIVRLVDGKVDPAQADAALVATREPAHAPRRRGGGRPPAAASAAASPSGTEPPRKGLGAASGGDLPTMLLKTRIKSEAERAKLLEIKAKVEAGKYVEVDEVKVAAFNKARVVRDGLLNIPDRLAAVLAAESEADKVHALLAAEIRQALIELSGGPDEA